MHRNCPQIEMCPDEGMEQLRVVAEEFMRTIFGLEPQDYLITDHSRLTDFTVDDLSSEKLIHKVMDTYHLGLVPNNLLLLFRQIGQRSQH